MDGNPIYDNKPIDVVLDECNGAFVMRDDGLMQYRYYATNTYPFTVGCFRDPPIINGGDECDGEELLKRFILLFNSRLNNFGKKTSSYPQSISLSALKAYNAVS